MHMILMTPKLVGVDMKDSYQPSAMACLLSHIKFYDLVIQNKHPMACVLEDDAQLLPTFLDILNYEKLSKQNWSILLLAHHSTATETLIENYYKSIFPTEKITNDRKLYWQYMVGAILKNSSTKYIKGHYIAKPFIPTEKNGFEVNNGLFD